MDMRFFDEVVHPFVQQVRAGGRTVFSILEIGSHYTLELGALYPNTSTLLALEPNRSIWAEQVSRAGRCPSLCRLAKCPAVPPPECLDCLPDRVPCVARVP